MLVVAAVAMLVVAAVAMLVVAAVVVVAVAKLFLWIVFLVHMLCGFPIGLLAADMSNHRINLLLLHPSGRQVSNRRHPIFSGTLYR